jgi:integrase
MAILPATSPPDTAQRRMKTHAHWGNGWGDGLPRTRNTLTALQVKSLPLGKHQDGGGLILDKGHDGTRWVFRYTIHGRRREMGLGPIHLVTLAAARLARDRAEALIHAGTDPITHRDRTRLEARAAAERTDPTLAEATTTAFDARKATLRQQGESGRWRSPLDLHVLPKIGKRHLTELTPGDIVTALKTIWQRQHPTAEKAISRLSIVLDHARRTGLTVPPDLIDIARHRLGAVHHESRHITATRWQDVPALYARLCLGTAAHDCLRLIILTALRSNAARGILWPEVQGDTLTIPAVRMKSTVRLAAAFRVPLSPAATQIITQRRAYAMHGAVFDGTKGTPLSETALRKALDLLNEPGRIHGFRTSFRTWAQDTQACTPEVAEAALGHTTGTKVQRAYARSDLLDQRRLAMNAWADWVTNPQNAKTPPP